MTASVRTQLTISILDLKHVERRVQVGRDGEVVHFFVSREPVALADADRLRDWLDSPQRTRFASIPLSLQVTPMGLVLILYGWTHEALLTAPQARRLRRLAAVPDRRPAGRVAPAAPRACLQSFPGCSSSRPFDYVGQGE